MSLKHSQNKGAPHFPHDYPDCPAGVRFQEEQEAELLDKFKRSAKQRAPYLIINIIIVRNMIRAVFSWDILCCQKPLCSLLYYFGLVCWPADREQNPSPFY